MGGSVFPPCCMTWGQTMVEVMKIKTISFKRSHACTAPSAPPCSGHRWPTPLPQTHGHSWASPRQPLLGPLLLSPGSWCAQSFICALQESDSPVLRKFWQFYGGVNGDLLQEGLCHTQVCCTQSPCPCSRGRCWPAALQETLKHSSPQSLWDLWVLVHGTFAWALQVSLAGMGFDSKHDFAPPTIFLGLLLYPWTWCIFFGGIQHFPVNGCSAVSCNFGVLTEDERMFFYSATLLRHTYTYLFLFICLHWVLVAACGI